MNHIPFELKDAPDSELRLHAINVVLKYCAEQVEKTEAGKKYMASHTIQQVRNHFNTSKWWEAASQLKVSWDALIDELLKMRQIMVTNGFVWVRGSERETNGN